LRPWMLTVRLNLPTSPLNTEVLFFPSRSCSCGELVRPRTSATRPARSRKAAACMRWGPRAACRPLLSHAPAAGSAAAPIPARGNSGFSFSNLQAPHVVLTVVRVARGGTWRRWRPATCTMDARLWCWCEPVNGRPTSRYRADSQMRCPEYSRTRGLARGVWVWLKFHREPRQATSLVHPHPPREGKRRKASIGRTRSEVTW
jgi:hypothetical protein